jgi:hypothetical protein
MNKKQTSPKMATLGAKVLDGSKKPTGKQSKELAGSVVSQAKGKKKAKK